MRFQGLVFASAITLVSAALTSCMVGPDWHPPRTPPTTRYTEEPQPRHTVNIPKSATAGKAQHFIAGRDITGDWWQVFHSQPINNLIETGIANSPNLVAAKATLIQAQENLNAQIGTLFPQVTLPVSAERQRFNAASFGQSQMGSSIFNLYNVAVNVSYTLDVFGALRRQVEAARAQVDYEQYELAAAYLTLTSNIVTSSIAVASARAQIDATQDIIKSLRRQLNIMRRQLKLGGVSGNDVLTQASQVAATEAQLPILEQQLSVARHSLAMLVGSLPADFVLPDIRLEQLHLPGTIPISLPSRLVRQRPDVQAAEALMDQANANVGVATANLFPQITLSGAFGYQALQPHNLFHSATEIWSGTGSLLQPIFMGGQLVAKRRAAIAAYQAAYAQYQQTVLQAFQNVADTLRALQHDAHTFRAETENEYASHKSLKIDEELYKLGGVNYTTLLIAEKQYQQAVIARVQAQATRYSDTAALFQALGGGWWNAGNRIRSIKPVLA
ncbi:MAG: efflux transporter outer membrane subunit [Pseudomonadota bacterium]